MQFSHIRLENWRNFSTIDVALQTRAFIVGPNASGKSNLLDTFRFLHDLVISGGGFQEAVLRRGGVTSIRNISARHPSNVVIDVRLEDDNSKISWRYCIVFNKKGGNSKQKNEPQLIEEKIWKNDELILNRLDDADKNDTARLSQTLLEQTFANQPFRDIADFFSAIQYSHIVPQSVRDPERSIGKVADPFGGDFLEQIAMVNERSRKARLRRIQSVLKIAIPQLSELRLERDERGTPHLHGKYDHWRPNGSWQRESEFSDGTLRLMGLLWALQDGTGPLLLEEPELSLHPGVVRYLPQMLRNVQREQKVAYRQTFISSHSSDLLSDQGIAPEEVLLLIPSNEGTQVKVGSELPEVRQELDSGFTIAEAVLPRTEPINVSRLASPVDASSVDE